MLYKFIGKRQIESQPTTGTYLDGDSYVGKPPVSWLEENGYKPLVDETGNCDPQYQYDVYYVNLTHHIAKRCTQLPDTRTPAEKREYAYIHRKCITYTEQELTVDEARELFMKYFAEANVKYTEIQSLIAEAKAQIREEFPDVVEPNESEE